MKFIYRTLFLTIGLISSTACSDFLDQDSPSEMSDKVVFDNEYYTQLALNKVYGGLTQDKTYSQFMPIVAGLNTDCELIDGLGSNATNSGHQRGCMNYNAAPGWGDLATIWDAMYGVIEDANLVVAGIDNSSLLAEGNEYRENMLRYKAEAKTLRAMLYLDLIRLFGDVPFKVETSQSDLSNAYLEKTDRDEIMDNLINDLEESIPNLPWAGSEQTTEHITRGYAHALLANIALTRAGWFIRETAKEGYKTAEENSDENYPTQRCDEETRVKMYELAEKHLSTIINSNKHALTATPAEYWLAMNIGELQTNTPENLFEIPMGINKSGELGYTVGFRVSGPTPDYGKKGNSTGTLKLTAPFFYSFDPQDTRRDLTCANTQLQTKNGYAEELLGNKPFEIYCGKWDYRKMAGNATWLAAVLAGDEKAKICSGINVVKMRYPQVLLMYAEVVSDLHTQNSYGTDLSGKACTISAYDALLQVHQRAFTNQAQAKQQLDQLIADKGFFEAIVQENAWELAGEGVRKFELIRWNLLSKKIDEFKKEYLTKVGTAAEGGWPEKVYFNYKKNSTKQYKEIDMTSITWDRTLSKDEQKAYEGNKDAFGKVNTTQTETNLKSISSGLNTPVCNRYLLPIASTTISTSNGKLHNSYGYSN